MVRTTRDLHISIVSVSVLPLSQSAPVPKYSITELPPSPCAFFEYNVRRLWGGSTNLPRGTPQETREKGWGRGRWCTSNKRKHVYKYTFIRCGDGFDLQLNHVHFKRPCSSLHIFKQTSGNLSYKENTHDPPLPICVVFVCLWSDTSLQGIKPTSLQRRPMRLFPVRFIGGCTFYLIRHRRASYHDERQARTRWQACLWLIRVGSRRQKLTCFSSPKT